MTGIDTDQSSDSTKDMRKQLMIALKNYNAPLTHIAKELNSLICDKCKKEMKILRIQRLTICDCGVKVATKEALDNTKKTKEGFNGTSEAINGITDERKTI